MPGPGVLLMVDADRVGARVLVEHGARFPDGPMVRDGSAAIARLWNQWIGAEGRRAEAEAVERGLCAAGVTHPSGAVEDALVAAYVAAMEHPAVREATARVGMVRGMDPLRDFALDWIVYSAVTELAREALHAKAGTTREKNLTLEAGYLAVSSVKIAAVAMLKSIEREKGTVGNG